MNEKNKTNDHAKTIRLSGSLIPTRLDATTPTTPNVITNAISILVKSLKPTELNALISSKKFFNEKVPMNIYFN